MQKLNVMLVSDSNSKLIDTILESKFLNKLYVNFEYSGIAEVYFNTFKELAQKCKALKIDIVVVENEKMILQGIADVLKANYVNCFALNSFWTQLILSNSFARNMMSRHGIEFPEKLTYPDQYPVVVKADGILKIANSLTEVLKLQREISALSPEIAQTLILERYIAGDEIIIGLIFDGKNLITFTENNCYKELIKEYGNKMQKMFAEEKHNFIGYINSRVIIHNQKVYHVGFQLGFPLIKQTDILYLIILVMYQKLNEINVYL